ncbi:hypothetical protein AYY18_06990 [Morganella psychrotolerans]|uniref:Uncharacterized protein n=1 Tax=Morganella psychrotolerans TaxID=368603 RepID=A0A1B8HAZ5_9GAMM|nr:hypothetical protein AYY18_06990 [Morganella psychrotolerans]
MFFMQKNNFLCINWIGGTYKNKVINIMNTTIKQITTKGLFVTNGEMKKPAVRPVKERGLPQKLNPGKSD